MKKRRTGTSSNYTKYVLIIVALFIIISVALKISSSVHQRAIHDINNSYKKLCDASYLIDSDDVGNPMYVKAYYDLEAQVRKHRSVFEKEYDAHVMVDILLASDLIDRTCYLNDFRCGFTKEYTVAYFDYYEDELARIREAYFERRDVFRPQYIVY